MQIFDKSAHIFMGEQKVTQLVKLLVKAFSAKLDLECVTMYGQFHEGPKASLLLHCNNSTEQILIVNKIKIIK